VGNESLMGELKVALQRFSALQKLDLRPDFIYQLAINQQRRMAIHP
jgi:hypothetical protein